MMVSVELMKFNTIPVILIEVVVFSEDSQEDRQIPPNTSNRRSLLDLYHVSNTLIIYIIGNYSNDLSKFIFNI